MKITHWIPFFNKRKRIRRERTRTTYYTAKICDKCNSSHYVLYIDPKWFSLQRPEVRTCMTSLCEKCLELEK